MEYILHFKNSITEEAKKHFEDIIYEIYYDCKFQDKFSKLCNKNVIFTIGGDGTFLSAINKYGIDYLYIPINAGTLGFYTSWNQENLKNLITKSIYLLKASMLKVTFNDSTYYCINETTIINPINTQILDVYINDKHLEHFRGTGVCVCTPTGSTAYNKSLNGAIIAPGKDLFELVKIAPINNVKYRTINNPIILFDDDKLKFSNKNFKDSIITIDRQNFPLDQTNEVTICIASKKLYILSSSKNFWERVKDKFIE